MNYLRRDRNPCPSVPRYVGWLTVVMLILILMFTLLPTPVSGITLGQIDTFQDASTDGWTDGSAGDNLAIVTTGGPAGFNDYFLQVSSGGSFPSRLITFNDSQWLGNYVAAGVTRVEMDLKNFGPN